MSALCSNGTVTTPSADLRERVLAEARRHRAPTRRQVMLRNAALLLSGVVIPLGIFLATAPVAGDARPQSLIWESTLGAMAITLTALVVALGRGRSMLGRSGMVLLALAIITPLAMLAWKLGVTSQFEGMTVRWPDRPGYRCLRLSCLLAAWPLVAFVLTRRASDPTHPRLTGAAIGAAVGAVAWVFVDWWCPVGYWPHLLFGHVLPVIVTTLVGAWLGRFIALRR